MTLDEIRRDLTQRTNKIFEALQGLNAKQSVIVLEGALSLARLQQTIEALSPKKKESP